MSSLAKVDFTVLDIIGDNYLSWRLNCKAHLVAQKLGVTLQQNNDAPDDVKAKALIYIRHHITESLQNQYLTEEDPLTLWEKLGVRYDHQKTTVLPMARSEWRNLRFLDYNTVAEYNSALYSITTRLELCGEKVTDHDMLEKTYTTFHPDNIVIQAQYRNMAFPSYPDLIQYMMVQERQNALLLQQHASRPTGCTPLPETHSTSFNGRGRGGRGGRNRGRGGRGGGGRGRGNGNNYNNYLKPRHDTAVQPSRWQNKWHNPDYQTQHKGQSSTPKRQSGKCHKCGMEGHFKSSCRVAEHLVALYQASIRGKGKQIEMNFASQGDNNTTHFEVEDYLADPENINSGPM